MYTDDGHGPLCEICYDTQKEESLHNTQCTPTGKAADVCDHNWYVCDGSAKCYKCGTFVADAKCLEVLR